MIYLNKILIKLERFLEDSKPQPQLIIMKKAHGSETYSEPSQTSKMKNFANIVDYSQPLTIFTKSSILGISHCYGYASDKTKQKFE